MTVAKFAVSAAVLLIMPLRAFAADIVIGNVHTESERIAFVLANTSRSKGDVVYWVKQRGVRKCERVFKVDADSKYEINMPCSSMQDGDFAVGAGWATDFPDAAAIAIRAD